MWEQDKKVVISVADTGVGMDDKQLHALREDLKEKRTAKVGIGLGNIYHRIRAMYREGDVKIYSRQGAGTVVQVVIPQDEKPAEGFGQEPAGEESDDSVIDSR